LTHAIGFNGSGNAIPQLAFPTVNTMPKSPIKATFGPNGVSFGEADFSGLQTSMPEINNVFPPTPPMGNWHDYEIPPPSDAFVFLGNLSMAEHTHDVLDAAGMVPLLGEPADLLNGVLYLADGEWSNATTSFASTIPGLGNYVTGAKWAKKGVKGAYTASKIEKQVIKHADDAEKLGQNFAKHTGDLPPLKGCFTEGTQIVVGMEQIEDTSGNLTTVYTTVNIEDIKAGDLVYSYNTLTGEVEQTEVTETFALKSDHVNYLTIVDEDGHEQVIETTDVHPFWVVTNDPDMDRAARDYVFENDLWMYHEDITPTDHGYWVEAKDLRVGDVFLSADGKLSTLTNVVRIEKEGGIAVFNFTVDGNHDYFILAKDFEYGQACVLVHNGICKPYKQRFECDYADLKKGNISDHPRLHADIPPGVPKNWGADKIQDAIEELDVSIPNRIADMANFPHPEVGHINRINNEQIFRLKLVKRLGEIGGDL